MAQIIHMETDLVLNLSASMQKYSKNFENQLSSLNSRINSLNWEGSSKDDFVCQIDDLMSQTMSLTTEIEELCNRLQQEVKQWIEVDQQGNESFQSIAVITGSLVIAGIVGYIFRGEIAKWTLEREFSRWWRKLSKTEKLNFLILEKNRIAKSLGVDTIPLVIEDLPDDNGDFRGQYRADEEIIVLDIDNIENDNPWDLINIIAHEMYHRKQHEAIDYYNNSGEPPPGISLSQVQTWEHEMKNYISSEEDFESYRSQNVEVDARAYASEYENQIWEKQPWK